MLASGRLNQELYILGRCWAKVRLECVFFEARNREWEVIL